MRTDLSFLLCALLPLAVFQNSKIYQLAENNVAVRFEEKRAEAEAAEVLGLAVTARQQLAEKYNLTLTAPVEIRLSRTTAEFCQHTGRPWWQGSVYQNRVIHLQPVRVLRERGILQTTLRHELMHRFVDEQAKGNCPAWLNEALAVYNSGEIVLLKPDSATDTRELLTWRKLDRRVQNLDNPKAAERLYFQLYHLGQFFERNFQTRQIAALMNRLGARTPFDQACREIWGVSAGELEQRWLEYWVR